jgi:hypothetical protein
MQAKSLYSLVVTLCLIVAGCSSPTLPAARSFDTGNMAFPQPLPQGNVATTRVP